MKFINLVLLSLTLASGVYAQGNERPWDEARYQGAMKEMEERDQVNRSQTAGRDKGLDMIATPENKEQIDKIKEDWHKFDDAAKEMGQVGVQLSYAEANNLPNVQELRERNDALTSEVNQRNAQLAEDMRPYNQALDIKIAEGQIDMRPYNPEFVEQHRQELQQKAEGEQTEQTAETPEQDQAQEQSQQTESQDQTLDQSQQTESQDQTLEQPQQIESQDQGMPMQNEPQEGQPEPTQQR